MSKFAFYTSQVIKGLFDIAVGTEEFILDDKGNVISKLPSKRKQVWVFAKNFLKEPVSHKLLYGSALSHIKIAEKAIRKRIKELKKSSCIF